MPKLAGVFTRILSITHVSPPEELFVFLLRLLFAVRLIKARGCRDSDLCNEETKQGFRSIKPPLGELNHC